MRQHNHEGKHKCHFKQHPQWKGMQSEACGIAINGRLSQICTPNKTTAEHKPKWTAPLLTSLPHTASLSLHPSQHQMKGTLSKLRSSPYWMAFQPTNALPSRKENRDFVPRKSCKSYGCSAPRIQGLCDTFWLCQGKAIWLQGAIGQALGCKAKQHMPYN